MVGGDSIGRVAFAIGWLRAGLGNDVCGCGVRVRVRVQQMQATTGAPRVQNYCSPLMAGMGSVADAAGVVYQHHRTGEWVWRDDVDSRRGSFQRR